MLFRGIEILIEIILNIKISFIYIGEFKLKYL